MKNNKTIQIVLSNTVILVITQDSIIAEILQLIKFLTWHKLYAVDAKFLIKDLK